MTVQRQSISDHLTNCILHWSRDVMYNFHNTCIGYRLYYLLAKGVTMSVPWMVAADADSPSVCWGSGAPAISAATCWVGGSPAVVAEPNDSTRWVACGSAT